MFWGSKLYFSLVSRVQIMTGRVLQGEVGNTGECKIGALSGFDSHFMWSMNERVTRVEAKSSKKTSAVKTSSSERWCCP